MHLCQAFAVFSSRWLCGSQRTIHHIWTTHNNSISHSCGVGVVIATESALSFSVLVYSCYAIVVASVNVFLWVVIIPTGFWYALCVFTVDAASGLLYPHNIIPVHTKANNGSGRGADGAPPYTIIFYISFSTRSDTGTGLRVYDYFQYDHFLRWRHLALKYVRVVAQSNTTLGVNIIRVQSVHMRSAEVYLRAY